ncbi:MAG: tRNA threonylcarbamoyladenosine dehydratase [Opitutales bacterium]
MDKEFLERFAGVGRLYGKERLARLSESSFMVVGLGGVGSWTAEALARSGVGVLTLVDGDAVCASNTNRQLHALEGAAGRPKTEAVAERARAIRPGLRTEVRTRFVTRANAAETLAGFTGVVVDAIDALSPKCALLDECRRRGLRTVSAGGCAGRLDGTRVRVTDLAQSREDALLMLVRKRLRQNFGFPRKGPFGISAVWSDELPSSPTDCEGLPGGEIPEDEALRPNCEWGYGTAAHVAGAFGLAAAGEAIRLALLPA